MTGAVIAALHILASRRQPARPAAREPGRVYARVTRAVRRPWQMYPVGLRFGLGFDTATEVALLATAAGAAAGGLPMTAVLALPLLFAAAMPLSG